MADEILHLKMRGDTRTYCLLDSGAVENTDLHYVEDVNCEVCRDGFADYVFRLRSMPRSDFRSLIDGLVGAGFALIGMSVILSALMLLDWIEGNVMLAVGPGISGPVLWLLASHLLRRQNFKWYKWSRRQGRILNKGRERIRQEHSQQEGA